MIGLFCKKALGKKRYSAKETYIFKEPNNRSHPIADYVGDDVTDNLVDYIADFVADCVADYVADYLDFTQEFASISSIADVYVLHCNTLQ